MTPSRPLRVLVTLDAVGGVWHYALDLARALGERQIETVLGLLGPAPTAEQRSAAHAIPTARLIETGLPLDWLCDGPEPVLEAGRAMAALASEQHVDLVQLNMPTLAIATFPVPTIAVTHGCVSTWWEAAKEGAPLAPDYAWHRTLMQRGLHAAGEVVAPTASYARTVQRHYRLPQLPRVVRNGRPPLRLTQGSALHDCALTVGRLWDRVKRADLLDHVAARLPFPFYAAGEARGPHGETATLDHLHLLGHLAPEALARRLAERPVFVSAASFEPFGLAALEAAQAGCALILSDIAGFRELWDGAALFVPSDDEEVWTDAIEQVVGDADQRHRLGQASQARAARYTSDATAEAMLRLYRSALQQGKVAA